jgi:hypothetical protein
MYSVYLLCWYKSTNADAGGGAGLFDTQFCNDNSECGSGECTYMAMNSYLQISSNGGQVRTLLALLAYTRKQVKHVKR